MTVFVFPFLVGFYNFVMFIFILFFFGGGELNTVMISDNLSCKNSFWRICAPLKELIMWREESRRVDKIWEEKRREERRGDEKSTPKYLYCFTISSSDPSNIICFHLFLKYITLKHFVFNLAIVHKHFQTIFLSPVNINQIFLVEDLFYL